jgi:hypothetical protein
MEGEYKENYLVAMRSEERRRRKKSDGFRHTEETKKKIGEKGRGRSPTEETRKKMSQAMTGKKLGDSHRINCIKAWDKRKKNKEV